MTLCACRQKEALARSHARSMEAAKQAAADERTAWRAAVTEKLKRQAAEREEKLRAELLKQRAEQLEVCSGRAQCNNSEVKRLLQSTAGAAGHHSTVCRQFRLQIKKRPRCRTRL